MARPWIFCAILAGPEIHPFHRPMKTRRLLLAIVCAGAALCSLRADDFKPEPGFISLFNGQDLTGWCYREEGKPDAAANASFDGKLESTDARYSAANGALVVHPKTPRQISKIWTQQAFPKNFELRLEFRAAVNSDSGIFIRGPQLQCRDYLVAGPYKALAKYKPQDWNEIVVVVKDGVAHCTCNGEVLEAALKLPATGPIGFEGDRGMMEYRRIRLKELL
jgi:hypothetical protein